MKRLLAWFKRRPHQQKSLARKPSPGWDQSAVMPEFVVPEAPDASDYSTQQEVVVQSFQQDTGWQPPACEAPSFDSSASFSAPSSCDTSSSSFDNP